MIAICLKSNVALSAPAVCIRSLAMATYCLFIAVGSPRFAQADDAAGIAFFEQKIRPLLAEHCYQCHSPKAEKLKGGLLLDSQAGWQAGGDSGEPVIVAGAPEESMLFTYVKHEGGNAMPPDYKLSDQSIADLREWIAIGAPDPRDEIAVEVRRADKSWWSLQKLEAIEPPIVEEAAWNQNPIDRFIAARLNQEGLAPNPPADPRTLIRRMCYDMLGLPPTPEEVTAFVNDCKVDRKQSIERLVDRLLQSPQYGERWGRHWLDVVRFGESNGFERNVINDDAWPFRDYVIRSINDDKPFNQFILEHLAGDVVGKDDPQVEIGSAFLVVGPYDDVGNQDVVAQANIRAATLDDIVTATGSAFLGLTIHCARCHHHKFDPIPTQDYYRLRAAFEGIHHGRRVLASQAEREEHRNKTEPLQKERQAIEAEIAAIQKQIDEAAQRESGNPPNSEKDASQTSAESLQAQQTKLAELRERLQVIQQQVAAIPPLRQVWIGNHSQPGAPTRVHQGGDPMKPLEEIKPAGLEVLSSIVPTFELGVDAPESERRLALGRWVVSDQNALTARVLANRVWHYHFGTGIVDTPSDFGFLGGKPSHPELLDWLATRLINHQWKLKSLHRDILLSQTYQQSSSIRDEAANIDKDARLLWRFPPRRLTGEELRDTLLFVTGKLDLKMGGPGFRLYLFTQNNVCTYLPLDQHGPETYRRAVYHQNARASVVDLLTDFDQPDNAFSAPRRSTTTSPLQSLTLLNHSFTLDMARALAGRAGEPSDSGDQARFVESVFQYAIQRSPTANEQAAAVQMLEKHGPLSLCRAMLNLNELLFVE
jgi:mono/diheme cytochrome c family protein